MTTEHPQPATAQRSDSPKEADSRNDPDPSKLSNETSFNDAKKELFTNLILLQ